MKEQVRRKQNVSKDRQEKAWLFTFIVVFGGQGR